MKSHTREAASATVPKRNIPPLEGDSLLTPNYVTSKGLINIASKICCIFHSNSNYTFNISKNGETKPYKRKSQFCFRKNSSYIIIAITKKNCSDQVLLKNLTRKYFSPNLYIYVSGEPQSPRFMLKHKIPTYLRQYDIS